MGKQITPLDRRPGELPVPGLVTGIIPIVIVSVSLAAGHTYLRGEPLGLALAWIYVVPLVLLGAVAAFVFGTRMLPAWALIAYPAALLGCPALLQISESMAPATLVIGLAMLVQVARAPRPPASADVAAQSASFGAFTGAGPELPPLGRATGAPAVRLRLLPPSMIALSIGVAVLCLAFGGVVGYASFLSELEIEGGATARWIATGVSVLATLFGLFLLSMVFRARRDTIEIDVDGIRRQGGILEWQLAWSEVRAVGVRRQTKVVTMPATVTVTPRRLRERRTVQLLLMPVVPDFGGREDFVPLRAGELSPPFTHAQALPDTTPWASRARLADTIAEALQSQVPDRYLVLHAPEQLRSS